MADLSQITLPNNIVYDLKDSVARASISGKLDTPNTTGTAGQILGLDNNLNTTWVNTPSVPVTDVQINGSSILSSGIANIPIANANTPGVVKVSSGGLYVNANGQIIVDVATADQIRRGVSWTVINTTNTHAACFYGLAKAAGDTTLTNSGNEIGTYTSEAKASIKTMLGVNDLPAVTSSDNGKILQVTNGAWAVTTLPIYNGEVI